jgi:hypothetical protein
MKKDVLEYVRDNTELRATIAHLSAVIEEARAAIEVDNEGHPNKVSLSILDNVLAILAKAHTSLRESLPLPREGDE